MRESYAIEKVMYNKRFERNSKIIKDNMIVDCLAFADVLAILAKVIETATVKMNTVNEMEEKTEPQISF